MGQTESDSHSHAREYAPVSWQARRLVDDHAELAAMSESDIQRYCGGRGGNDER